MCKRSRESLHLRPLLSGTFAMTRMSDIITVCVGAVALFTLVYAKDRSTPTPGVRTAIELTGHKAQQRTALSRTLASASDWATP